MVKRLRLVISVMASAEEASPASHRLPMYTTSAAFTSSVSNDVGDPLKLEHHYPGRGRRNTTGARGVCRAVAEQCTAVTAALASLTLVFMFAIILVVVHRVMYPTTTSSSRHSEPVNISIDGSADSNVSFFTQRKADGRERRGGGGAELNRSEVLRLHAQYFTQEMVKSLQGAHCLRKLSNSTLAAFKNSDVILLTRHSTAPLTASGNECIFCFYTKSSE